jgi:hypothetical protein
MVAFIGSHPGLAWSAVLEKAQAQACRFMFLVASSLARNVFGSAVPDAIVAAERADPAIEPAIGRVVASWQIGKPTEPRADRIPSATPSESGSSVKLRLKRQMDAEHAVSINPNDGRVGRYEKVMADLPRPAGNSQICSFRPAGLHSASTFARLRPGGCGCHRHRS